MPPIQHNGSPSRSTLQRPRYVAPSAFDDVTALHLASPASTRQTSNGARGVGPATPISSFVPSPAKMRSDQSVPGSATSRLSRVSPSAYQRFDEVAWVVDLSSRIGNALQSPSRSSVQGSAAASPSSSSLHNQPRSRSRVRLPRPSREFRDLQQRLQLKDASASTSGASEADLANEASFASDNSLSAIQWAQSAQNDFERRRVDLERSRKAVLERMAGSHDDGSEQDLTDAAGSADSKPPDPAVERSRLAAESLRELMRGGGLQSEDPQDDQADFADILSSAQPLSSADLDLGPSSLFEANRGADGALDIESILQQRARIASLEAQHQAGPSSSVPAAPKRPVIEVLGGNAAAASSNGPDADDSEESPSDSSSDSDSSDSSSESGSDASADDSDESASAHSIQSQRAIQPSSALHPMDQIAIVNGTFTIVPAQNQQRAETADGDSARSDDSDRSDDSEDEDSEADASSDEDEDEDTAYGNRQHFTAQDQDDAASPHDSAFDGPAGDADEPIVLSDSDEGSESSDHADTDTDSDEADSKVAADVENHKLSSADQLKDDARSQPSDVDQRSDFGSQGQAHDADSDAEGYSFHPSQSVETRSDGDRQAQSPPAMQVQGSYGDQVSLPAEPMELDVQTAGATPHDQDASAVDDAPLFATYLAEPDNYEMPESEVEPEEFDEDLRWSDLDTRQSSHEDTSSSQLPASSLVGSAFRALQGSQPLPGFVTASQLQASIETNSLQADDAFGRSTAPAFQAGEQIDPDLFASSGSQQDDQDPHATKQEGLDIARDVESAEQASTIAARAKEDRAGAITPQGASTGDSDELAREIVQDDARPLVGQEEESRDPSAPAADETKAADADTSLATKDTPANQVDVSAPIEGQDDDKVKVESIEVAHIDDEGDALLPPVPASATSVVLAETEEGDSPPPIQPRGDILLGSESASIGSSSAAPLNSSAEVATTDNLQPAKPVLTRIESTDVLEADIEDNSEDEGMEEPVLIEAANTSALPSLLSQLSDDEAALEPAAVHGDATGLDVIVPDEGIAGEDVSARAFLHRPAISTGTDDEGILSGDLADRDTSVERQAAPLNPKPSEQDKEDESESEKPADGELAASIAVPAKRKLDGESDAGEEQEDPEELPQAEQDGDKSGPVEPAPPKKAKLDLDAGNVSNELPAVPESGEVHRPSDSLSLFVPQSLSTSRVPPSPASSDRRSTSSFTPSANRHGHRHLHGAAKRNLLSQMTEVASNLASNLTAPLRALPSLLPIRETPADEAQRSEGDTEAATVGAGDEELRNQPKERDQAAEPVRQAEPPKFTITTRSHCLYRRLQLSDVSGAPVFLVPGCSINHEDARDEHAHDLGEASEQSSDDWVDVDPDLLPSEIHHMLSRIVGLQILREGIFAEPNSAAAELLAAGYDTDMDLQRSTDDMQRSFLLGKLDVEAPSAAEEPVARDPETPSRPNKHHEGLEATRNAASASPQRRSPRRSDPSNAEADYLPDEERKHLARGRHLTAVDPGDVSIASLEEQVDEEAGDAADLDNHPLLEGEKSTGEYGKVIKADSDAEPVTPAPEPKRKRGRPRKNATADTKEISATDVPTRVDESKQARAPKPRAANHRRRQRSASTDPPSAGDVEGAGRDSKQSKLELDAADSIAAPRPRRSDRVRQGREGTPALDTVDQESVKVEGAVNDSGKAGRRSDPGDKVESGKGETKADDSSSQAQDEDNVETPSTPARKRKQAAGAGKTSAGEAETSEKTDQAVEAKQPRRGRRSQGGTRAHSTSPTKTTPRKSPKRKVLKLN